MEPEEGELVEVQEEQPGHSELRVAPMTGEGGGTVGGEMQEVDSTGTEGQVG